VVVEIQTAIELTVGIVIEALAEIAIETEKETPTDAANIMRRKHVQGTQPDAMTTSGPAKKSLETVQLQGQNGPSTIHLYLRAPRLTGTISTTGAHRCHSELGRTKTT
jgi:hypothetical protein